MNRSTSSSFTKKITLIRINSFGGFGGFDTFESDSDKNLNQIILSLTAEGLVIPKTRSVSFYYENIWKQMVKSSGCRLERKFPVHDFLLDIEKMNKEFSYEFLDKILKYVLRNREHGILRKNDFQFMDRFAGKRDSLEQQTESRSAIRCLKEDLIGIEQVKEQVMETVQVMKFNKYQQGNGVKKGQLPQRPYDASRSGTAKTTVAKLMGKIMEEKLLPGSQFACVNGAELKGMYVAMRRRQKLYSRKMTLSSLTKPTLSPATAANRIPSAEKPLPS